MCCEAYQEKRDERERSQLSPLFLSSHERKKTDRARDGRTAHAASLTTASSVCYMCVFQREREPRQKPLAQNLGESNASRVGTRSIRQVFAYMTLAPCSTRTMPLEHSFPAAAR